MTHGVTTFFGNPAFREYIFLLVELERLFRHGQGQSAQADAIREEMDFPMHRYDTCELDALKEFGSHLKTMSAKYGHVLDRNCTDNTPVVNGVPHAAVSSKSGGSMDISK
jgi:hypothetical protein